MNVGYNTKVKDEKLKVLDDGLTGSDKYVVWHIEGGLGKNIAATSLLQDLSEKYPDRKIITVVSYPEIFLNNPYIHRVYRIGSTSYFYDDYINDKDTIVFRQEPYYQSDHITKKKHLIHNWCDLLGLNYVEQLPKLYPNAVQKNIFQGLLREKPILLLQTNGGGIGNNISYSWSRDMPFYVALEVAKKYENTHHIIQVTKPNTPLIPNAEHFIQQMSNFEQISLLAASDKRLLIDSSLQHAAAGMNLKSTVLWIGTSPINYGYRMHTNIVANPPQNTNKMIDSYLFDYSLEGLVHECPYNNLNEIFNLEDILNSI
jgi:signal peptidase I